MNKKDVEFRNNINKNFNLVMFRQLGLLIIVIIMLAACGQNSVDSNRLDSENNGSTLSTQDTSVSVDGNWFKFTFGGIGSSASGEPFTFTVPSEGTFCLAVTDAFLSGDQFEVFDFGSSIGSTSLPTNGFGKGNDYDGAFTDPNFSSGTFPMAPGSHSITIVVILTPFTGGGAALRIGSSCSDAVDTNPPTVTVTGVEDGESYILGNVPVAGCDTTDAESGVATHATLNITGGGSYGLGMFTATCSGATDNAGNAADPVTADYEVIDPNPPIVTVTGVQDGESYILGNVPVAGCDTTDAESGVATHATLNITGGNGNGLGMFTATCSGATDNEGNVADPVTADYEVTNSHVLPFSEALDYIIGLVEAEGLSSNTETSLLSKLRASQDEYNSLEEKLDNNPNYCNSRRGRMLCANAVNGIRSNLRAFIAQVEDLSTDSTNRRGHVIKAVISTEKAAELIFLAEECISELQDNNPFF